MRMWIDPSGAIVDDERLLSYVAAHGSLSDAVASGDFKLMVDSAAAPSSDSAHGAARPVRSKRLSDYLE